GNDKGEAGKDKREPCKASEHWVKSLSLSRPGHSSNHAHSPWFPDSAGCRRELRTRHCGKCYQRGRLCEPGPRINPLIFKYKAKSAAKGIRICCNAALRCGMATESVPG